MEDTRQILDSLAQTDGEELKNEEYVSVEGSTAKETVDKASQQLNSHPYGESGPMPGDRIGVEKYMDEAKNITKESAINSMLAQSAIYKAQREAAEQQNQPKKLTKEEREARKKQVVDYLMYQQEEAYFLQHHYIMDGKTKRRVRAMISRNYDKGKYKPKSTNLNG